MTWRSQKRSVLNLTFSKVFFSFFVSTETPSRPLPSGFLLIHSELISRPRRHALFFLHISTCFVVDRCDSNDDWKFLRLLLEAPDYHYKSIYDEKNMEHAAREATRFRWFALSWTWDEEKLILTDRVWLHVNCTNYIRWSSNEILYCLFSKPNNSSKQEGFINLPNIYLLRILK